MFEQSAPSDRVPSPLLGYYNTYGQLLLDTQVSDFDSPNRRSWLLANIRECQTPFDCNFSKHPQEDTDMCAPTHQPRRAVPIQFIMDIKPIQDDIWRSFMGHLGLQIGR
jgi:hypothetical protein